MTVEKNNRDCQRVCTRQGSYIELPELEFKKGTPLLRRWWWSRFRGVGHSKELV